MPKTSGWETARTYVRLATECTSSYVVATYLAIVGRSFVKHPVARAAWYIGSVALASVVGGHVGKVFEETITETEEAVKFIQEEVDKVLADSNEA